MVAASRRTRRPVFRGFAAVFPVASPGALATFGYLRLPGTLRGPVGTLPPLASLETCIRHFPDLKGRIGCYRPIPEAHLGTRGPRAVLADHAWDGRYAYARFSAAVEPEALRSDCFRLAHAYLLRFLELPRGSLAASCRTATPDFPARLAMLDTAG